MVHTQPTSKKWMENESNPIRSGGMCARYGQEEGTDMRVAAMCGATSWKKEPFGLIRLNHRRINFNDVARRTAHVR
jgi:hypothetical protein